MTRSISASLLDVVCSAALTAPATRPTRTNGMAANDLPSLPLA